MGTKKLGKQTLAFAAPPTIAGYASVVGKKEGQGPLAGAFDLINQDDSFGESSWEKAESTMQRMALETALDKAGQSPSGLDLLFAGDLLNQCIASSFAARGQDVSFLGLYGACSTMAEGLALAAMALDGGFGERAAAVASSHFCSAERQYRTPLEYGGQRTPTAQWTVTGAGACVLTCQGTGPCITHATLGKVIDKGIKDANNMGAAMAPAACDTLAAHFSDTGRRPSDYDLIVTGDLGELGKSIVLDLFRSDGVELPNYDDCGVMIFDLPAQDVHCGGSGCGCSAVVLNGYLLRGMAAGRWKKILFCGTGALLSPISSLQGESIPGICHAVAISTGKGG